ncbi:tetraspanin-1-like, partial [Clarias magur]
MSLKVILKIVMVIVNSAIFLAGAGLVIIGALPEIKKTTVLEALYNSTVVQHIPADFAPLFNATYLLIAVGAVLAFMGFLGLWGAYYEDKCILMILFIIIFIVFVAEVVAAILLLLYQPKEPVIGCFHALMKLLKANSSLLGGVAVFVIAVEIAGVGTLTIGIFIEINTKQADGKPGLEYLANAAYTLITIGCILTIISFQGCYGAMFENKCMLMTFFIIILMTVIMEVVIVSILLFTPQ